MFVIEILHDGAWEMERGDYYTDDGAAITEAKRRAKADDVQTRRVVTWPDPREVWSTLLTKETASVPCQHTEE